MLSMCSLKVVQNQGLQPSLLICHFCLLELGALEEFFFLVFIRFKAVFVHPGNVCFGSRTRHLE